MMCEEFESLTGLTVSGYYYTEIIEPEYTGSCIDKQSFCAQWLKAHKTDICKALGSDIDRMTREDATQIFKAAEHDRTAKLLKERTQEKEDLETEIHNLKTELNLRYEAIKGLTGEMDKLKETADSLETNHREMLDISTNHEKALTAKDMEITRLKAMLFDLMYKTA